MKTSCSVFIVTVLFGLTTAMPSLGQGTLNFSNFAPPMDAPIFCGAGNFHMPGPHWVAQLYAGPVGGALQPVGVPVPFGTGEAAGYFFGGTVTIPGIPGGAQANARVRVWPLWSGQTYQTSNFRLESTLLTLTLGGGGIPPSPPNDLIGLTSFHALFNLPCVPEPCTLTAALALSILFVAKRRTFL